MNLIAKILGEEHVSREIAALLKRTGATLKEEVTRAARLLAVSLATSTQPYGLSVASKKMGQTAVATDIGKVFIGPAAFYERLKDQDPKEAPAFWKAWRARDTATLEQIVQRSPAGSGVRPLSVPTAALHQQRRTRGGRVPGGKRTTPSAVIFDPAALRAYVREVQSRVGLAKSGWAHAAAACGGTAGLPGWASTTKHPRKSGSATTVETHAGPKITIDNTVPYIRQALPEAMERQATDIARQKLINRMTILMAKPQKKI